MHIAVLQILLGIVSNMLPMIESQTTKPPLRRNVTCVYSSSDNLTAHCTHTAFEKVPRNLNPEIQELTLKAVSVHQFDETSFSPYKKLTVLNLICIALHNTKKAIYENAFKNLTKLHTLKLDTIFTKFNASLNYPPNLQNLSLNNNDFFTEVDLQGAPSLTSFYAQRCSLLSFPKFNPSAPIETVDVRWNPMDNWTAEDLAPLCQLKMIYIEWDKNTSSLPKPHRYCQCIRLENWIKINDIITSNPLNCTPPEKNEKNEPCNMEYPEHMMNEYRKCMGAYSSTLNIILGTSMLTAVASTAGYRAKLVSTKPLDKGKTKPAKKIDRKKNRRPDTNTTKAPEKTERGGDADIEGEKDSAKEEEEEEEEEGEEEEGDEEDEQGEEEDTDTGEEDTNTEEELGEQDEETENKLVHGIQKQR